MHRDQPTDTDREAAAQLLGRGFREKVPSFLLRGYVTHSVFAKNPSPYTPSSNTSSGTPYPLAHYINYDKFSVNYCKFLAAIVSGHDPKYFKEAMKHEGWR